MSIVRPASASHAARDALRAPAFELQVSGRRALVLAVAVVLARALGTGEVDAARLPLNWGEAWLVLPVGAAAVYLGKDKRSLYMKKHVILMSIRV